MRLLFSAIFKTGSSAVGKEGPVILSSAKELSSFSYFQRSSVGEMFTFFSRTFANNKALLPGARTSVKQQGYQCHLYVSPTGVTACCFADDEYPARVAFGYLSRLCELFAEMTGGQLPSSTEDNCVPSFQVPHQKLITQFQDPSQADQLTRIMHELEQTKLVLHETIEAALERGQKIDDLIVKSNDLSGSSKMFYKTAKKQNQCCRCAPTSTPPQPTLGCDPTNSVFRRCLLTRPASRSLSQLHVKVYIRCRSHTLEASSPSRSAARPPCPLAVALHCIYGAHTADASVRVASGMRWATVEAGVLERYTRLDTEEITHTQLVLVGADNP